MTDLGTIAARVGMVALAASLAAPGACRATDGATEAATPESTFWAWSPSVLLYVVPGEPAYFQPTLAVDHGALHLEARYNYEARETASAWVGWNFSFGDDEARPHSHGGWRLRADEGGRAGPHPRPVVGAAHLVVAERVRVRFGDESQSYLYVWSELSVTGPEWLRVGLVLQRTRAFQTETQVQGGPLAGVTFWKLSATVYFFAPGQEDQFVVVSASGSF